VNTRRRPTQARSLAKAEAVLDAASRLAVGGVEHLSAAAIADEAGIAAGTLYQYFEGVDSVIDGVVRRHLDRFVMVIEQTFADRTFTSPLEASVAVGEAFVEYYRAEPGFRAIWFGPSFTSRHRALDLENNRRLAATMYQQLIRQDLIPESELAEAIVISNWEIADTLTGLAFRTDPDGDELVLGYLRYVMSRIAEAPPLDVVIELMTLRNSSPKPTDG
jgi:AcrR family transcriptional regulator